MHTYRISITRQFRVDGVNSSHPSVQAEGTLFRFLSRDDCEKVPAGNWGIHPDGDGGLVLVVKTKDGRVEPELDRLRAQALDRVGVALAAAYTPDARGAWNLDTNPLPALRKRHPWLEWRHGPATSGHKERLECPVGLSPSNYCLG